MFLYSLLSTSIYKTLLNREKRGQTSHLYAQDVRHIRIPISPINKQNTIAEHIKSLRMNAKALQAEGKAILEDAKRKVEEMIIG
jgi:restriction endonuclease S subunit